MGLKPDRGFDNVEDISFYMNATGSRGSLVVHSTAGSGAAMDSSAALVVIPTTASGTNPVGLLMNDVVNIDLTRQHLNQHRDETQMGGKVTILKRGWVVTDNVSGTPAGTGETLWYTNGGILTTVDPVPNGAVPKVGRIVSKKDADGYAKVEINITG